MYFGNLPTPIFNPQKYTANRIDTHGGLLWRSTLAAYNSPLPHPPAQFTPHADFFSAPIAFSSPPFATAASATP